MAYALSPGVTVYEKDFTSIVPAVSSSTGAFAGGFAWGPVSYPVMVSSENELVAKFGKPTASNFEDFFTAGNFLSYSGSMYIARKDSASAVNAVTTGGTATKIKNIDHYGTLTTSTILADYAAKYPGTLGNSLLVSYADSASYGAWAYKDKFDGAPGTSSYATSQNATQDELHVIVIDEDGAFTGTAGTVLEKFAYVSKASDARKYDGTNNYYKDVINNTSQYIWWLRHTTATLTGTTAWGSVAAGSSFKTLGTAVTSSLAGGVDDYTDAGSYAQAAWLLYVNDSAYDISLLPVGKATAVTAAYVISNVAAVRKDCVAFVSLSTTAGVMISDTSATISTDATAFVTAVGSSSYGVMDSGYKYQYDRYNDVYRWVPLNGDIAGLTARTDMTNDAWWSPAGFNRGQIKNVVKLALNPDQSRRDEFYKQGINPVITLPGQGTILYGDKTLQGKPSAFDRINVRRLFIVLEKAIGIAAKYQLFEFNDDFTRAQFKSIVEPFLRDVKGRRGITDFRVKCDATNNPGEVIDRNEFVADIFIKPARSINYVTLSFVATRTGVDFTTVGA